MEAIKASIMVQLNLLKAQAHQTLTMVGDMQEKLGNVVKEEAVLPAVGEKRKRAKKEKKIKDPNAPKKPSSSYFVFRTKILKSNEASGIKQTSAEISEMWNGMSEEEKAPYTLKYQKALEQYKSDTKTYTSSKSVGGGEEDDDVSVAGVL